MCRAFGRATAGGFGRKSETQIPQGLIAWRKATKARCATTAGPTTRWPMVMQRYWIRDAFPATTTNAGGLRLRTLTSLQLNKENSKKLILALVIFGIAAFFFIRFANREDGYSEKTFFYDISEEELFAAQRSAVPPISGLNNEQKDAVRAVVISTNGSPEDKTSWKISYLEMYSPELKKQFEATQAGGPSPQIGRAASQSHRFVRRVNDRQWYSLISPEGEKIVSEWLTDGPNGGPAVICTP